MNPLAELDQLNLEPTAKTEVAVLIQALLEQAERDAKTIQAKDLKIAALTHELATTSASVSAPRVKPWRRCNAMCSRKPGTPTFRPLKPKPKPKLSNYKTIDLVKPLLSPNVLAPVGDHLPRIEHRHEPESCACGHCGKDLVKIGDNFRDAGGRATQERLLET